MASKFPEAMNRIFNNVYVCRKCKTKRRSIPKFVLGKKLTCKRCGSKAFRPLKKTK